MKNVKKILSISLVAVMAVSMFTGCGDDTATSGERKLTYWLGNSVSSAVSDYNDAVALQKMQESIGIEVEFIHPSSALWEEQFNIMLASGDLTDIIQYNWGTKYNGGYDGALNDGLIVDLSDKLDKMPNFKKILEENPDYDKTIRTTDGKLLYVASFNNDLVINSSMGPMIRKDWLDKLGLEVPETISDWYTVLKAFKEKDPNGNGQADEIPFASYKSPAFNWFAAAYGTKKGDVYVKNGKVVYGTTQPEFKEFITEMAKWYKEGLIDNEFAALEKSVMDANMTNDFSGATIAYVGGSMGAYLSAKKDDPNYNLVAAPWPAKTAGAPNYIGTQLNRKGGGDVGSVITTKCKDIDLALEFIDYSFGEEATDFQNWGVEGETYTVENGEKKFTDFIMKNPEGKSPTQAINPIAFTAYGTPPRVVDGAAYSQIQYSMPQQAEASVLWSKGDDSLMTDLWPMTAEEKERVSAIKTEMTAYEDEMYTKMVMGIEPVEKFEQFVAEMEKFGVKELESLYQTAYDRFMK
ncbi:MAG: extracellular solute-binding protein [Clostridia bacterium]|nr:extracellular solute-binding protein [Clostridia bacterium]